MDDDELASMTFSFDITDEELKAETQKIATPAKQESQKKKPSLGSFSQLDLKPSDSQTKSKDVVPDSQAKAKFSSSSDSQAKSKDSSKDILSESQAKEKDSSSSEKKSKIQKKEENSPIRKRKLSDVVSHHENSQDAEIETSDDEKKIKPSKPKFSLFGDNDKKPKKDKKETDEDVDKKPKKDKKETDEDADKKTKKKDKKEKQTSDDEISGPASSKKRRIESSQTEEDENKDEQEIKKKDEAEEEEDDDAKVPFDEILV